MEGLEAWVSEERSASRPGRWWVGVCVTHDGESGKGG